MRKHATTGWHQGCAMPAHGLIGSNILGVHALGFFDERLLDLRNWVPTEQVEFCAHAADGPEEIYCRRSCLADYVADRIKLLPQRVDVFCFGIFNAQCDAHSSSYANGGRTTNDHGAYYVSYLVMSCASDIHFFSRQLRLIDEAYAG